MDLTELLKRLEAIYKSENGKIIVRIADKGGGSREIRGIEITNDGVIIY